MIALSEQMYAVVSPDGTRTPVDFDRLRSLLDGCCREAGVSDAELPDDVLRVVLTYLNRQTSHEGNPIRPGQIEALVARVLTAAGLHGAAAAFARQHPDAVDPTRDPVFRVSVAAAAEVLAGDPFFVGKPVTALAGQVCAALRGLKLEQVTVRGCVEIAKSLWLAERQSKSTEGTARYWAVHASEMAALLSPELVQWHGRRALFWQSVSFLVPVIALRVDLARLGPADEFLPELAFYPELDLLCRELSEALPGLRRTVAERCREQAPDTVRAELRFSPTREFGRTHLHLGGGALGEFVREVAEICHHHFGALAWVRVQST